MTGTERVVLITGDREWTDRDRIKEKLSCLRPNAIVLQGACRGADMIAGEIGVELGLRVIGIPAEWDKWAKRGRPKAAGAIRNREMLALKPDLVIAFHHNLLESKGTADCVRAALLLGIAVDTVGCALPVDWLRLIPKRPPKATRVQG